MNDLLNEEDFLPKEYNPWKWFYTYSLLGFALNSSLLLTAKYFANSPDLFNFSIIFSLFITPVLFSILVSFYPKQQQKTTSKTKSIGIALIYTGNLIGILIPAVTIYIRNNILVDIWLVLAIIFCVNIVSYSVVVTSLNMLTNLLFRRNLKKNERFT